MIQLQALCWQFFEHKTFQIYEVNKKMNLELKQWMEHVEIISCFSITPISTVIFLRNHLEGTNRIQHNHTSWIFLTFSSDAETFHFFYFLEFSATKESLNSPRVTLNVKQNNALYRFFNTVGDKTFTVNAMGVGS